MRVIRPLRWQVCRLTLSASVSPPLALSVRCFDPPGSVTIIEVAGVGNRKTVRHVGFQAFDTTEERERLQQDGVRIFGPGATVSQDLEPEYISIAGNAAYVTLQENNALAIINIEKATVERIVGLGLKDHSLVGNALDTSDQDGGINIRNWPIYGLYEPDAIHAFNERGPTYLIMANEGDAREYAGYAEAVRLNNTGYRLDPIAFPTRASTLTATATSIASKNGRPCGVRTARASRQCP